MNIGNISAQNEALSFLVDAASRADSKEKADPTDTLLAGLEESDPDRASDLRNELENSKQILQQVKSAKQEFTAQRKMAAKKKVEQIKAKIMALRMMAANGDPKSAARQAARLARELKAAVREYRNAGGSASGSDTYNVSSSSSTASAATATAATASAEANTASTEMSQSVAAAASTAAVATEASMEAVAVENAVSDATAAESSANELAATDADDADADDVRAAIDEQIAQDNEKARADEEDKAFVREVRRLMDELKDILKKAKQKMQYDGDQSSNRDVMQAEKELRDIEQSLGDISAGALSITVSIDIKV